MSEDFEFKWLESKRHPKGKDVRLKGGPGSGHEGHVGRPGSVGGSVPSSGGVDVPQASQQLYKLLGLYEARDNYRAWGDREKTKDTTKKIKEIGDIKAPGYGEWQKGEYRNYDHLEHPEYGTVRLSYGGGLHAQGSAASASVDFRMPGEDLWKSATWSGENARKNAEKFLKKHWGIERI